jgi:hypothetical protein
VLLAADGELPAGIGRHDCVGFDRPVFCFLDRPGNCDLPSVLYSGLKLDCPVWFFFKLVNLNIALRTRDGFANLGPPCVK